LPYKDTRTFEYQESLPEHFQPRNPYEVAPQSVKGS